MAVSKFWHRPHCVLCAIISNFLLYLLDRRRSVLIYGNLFVLKSSVVCPSMFQHEFFTAHVVECRNKLNENIGSNCLHLRVLHWLIDAFQNRWFERFLNINFFADFDFMSSDWRLIKCQVIFQAISFLWHFYWIIWF